MTFARQHQGQSPFQETWFVEALFSSDRGLWIRYVLDARTKQAEIWALVVTRDGVIAQEKATVPLAEASGPLFSTSAGSLSRHRATGSIGAISWDLQLDDLGVRYHHVPRLLPYFGIGRTYVPAIADLRIRGHVTMDDATWTVERGMGVLGHIWGASSRVRSWSWAHCNAFYEEGVIFEGLSARLGRVPLTSVMLHVHGHTYGFSRLRDLVSSKTSTIGSRWTFEARRGTALLTGELTLDPSSAATVRYDTDRGPLFCTNTRFADIRVVLHDPARGVDVDVWSQEAAFEIVGERALGPVVL